MPLRLAALLITGAAGFAPPLRPISTAASLRPAALYATVRAPPCVLSAKTVPSSSSSPRRLQLLQSVCRGVGRAARVTGSAIAGVFLSTNLAFGATTATFGSVPIVPRFKYALSRFLVNNGIGVVLLSFVGFALLGGFLYAVTKSGGETFGDSAFKAYTLLNNVPGADATADESLAGKLVSQLMYTIHVATFAIIIGIVSDKISSSVDSLRTSNERVQEVSDH